MNIMRIANWETWQTYRKDRGAPPWIKIHRNLLSNPEWASLTDAEKGQLVSIWVVAADKGGQISNDPVILRKICQLDDPPDVTRFARLGFFVRPCQPDDNQMTTTPAPVGRAQATSQQQPDAAEAEAEAEAEKNKDCQTPFDQWWSVWPRKVKKKESREIWQQKKLNSKCGLLVADVENRILNDERWKKGYIPDPPKYLNGERYNDEITNRGPTCGAVRETPAERQIRLAEKNRSMRRGDDQTVAAVC